jgi:hypothetical protein
MAWEMTIFRAKVMLVVTTKTYTCLQHKKIDGYQTNIDGYNSPIKNDYCEGKIERCYVDINKLPDTH